MPAGAPPATPTLASASSIRCQPHCQSSRTTRSPRVHPDALTFAIRQTDRSDPRRPTSSSHAPWLNPHSACGSAGAPPTAISCLGAFWTPAASVGGGARHRRRPKTCTHPDIPLNQWRGACFDSLSASRRTVFANVTPCTKPAANDDHRPDRHFSPRTQCQIAAAFVRIAMDRASKLRLLIGHACSNFARPVLMLRRRTEFPPPSE